MLYLNIQTLCEFSRNYCIPICAFLVPANLLATSCTLLWAFFGKSLAQIKLAAVVASILAFALVFHVSAWLAIGVVMAPTYILPALAIICLSCNFAAIKYRESFPQIWEMVVERVGGFSINQQ